MPETPLEQLIRERLRAEGALTFADYMDLALYHPQYGYYTAGAPRVGWAGDFFTSAHLHPLFGLCLARQLGLFWEALRRPRPFFVLEEGAGAGVLARHIQAAAAEHLPALAEALEYRLVDVGGWLAVETAPKGVPPPSPPARTPPTPSAPLAPKDASGGLEPAKAAKAAWDGSAHVLLSNELIDAFPVHIVEARGGQLLEVYVVERDGRLAEQVGEPSSLEVAGYLDAYKVPWRGFADGWRAEVNLRALAWMRRTAARLRPRGFVLTIDYGDTARRLYTRWRRRGTLLCYWRHSTNEQPLLRPGQQDITAHVNFSALIAEGRRAGLARSRFATQRDLLLGWGIRDEVERLRTTLYASAETARHTDAGQVALLRFASLRNAVEALLDPGGLGGFRVLVQRKRRSGAPVT